MYAIPQHLSFVVGLPYTNFFWLMYARLYTILCANYQYITTLKTHTIILAQLSLLIFAFLVTLNIALSVGIILFALSVGIIVFVISTH